MNAIQRLLAMIAIGLGFWITAWIVFRAAQ